MDQLSELRKLVRDKGKNGICLAFSGGVDSAVLLKVASEAGVPLLAVTFHTMLHPAADTQAAKKMAEEMGAEHLVLEIDEFQNPKVMENSPDRCYHCKYMLFEQLVHVAQERRLACVMDGTNLDDLSEYRPGLRALEEWGVLSPLAACKLGKAEVRKIAAELGLSVATKPSSPCMATRFPYGQLLSRELLRQAEEAEAALKELGFYNVRVRCHNGIARIEVDQEALTDALKKKDKICTALKECGFDYVTLDLEGFRSGSMDLHIKTDET